MGAQSVTGKGVGSAESMAKGPKERNFVGVEKLIGPRVMAAGKVTLVANAGRVDFANPLPCVAPLSAAATPPTPENDYMILVQDETDTTKNNAIVVATINSDAAGVTHSSNLDTCLKGFTLASGGATDVVAWTVIKVGN